MILYRSALANTKRERPESSINISLDEKLERPTIVFNKTKDKVRFIKDVEMMVRRSDEYRDHIKFLKNNLDMNRCEVLKGLSTTNGRRYRIEIHHEPFTLFDIVQTVVNKHEALSIPLNQFMIADEVEELHYSGKVGLVPLSKTMHDLVHADKIFIPLQKIYHSYDKFFNEYEEFMDPKVIEKLEAKVELSLKCPDILSDVLDTEFVYVNIEGVNLPEIPEEWKDAMSMKDENE